MKLNKNSSNIACFRLNSKSGLTGDTKYHLFHLTNSSTRQDLIFTGTDVSTNQDLFNEFRIIETGLTAVNLTASTINLEPAGWWSYSIYEMTGQTNLDISGTTGQVIEFGKMQVIELTATTAGSTYQHTEDNDTRYVYKPN